MKSTRTNPNLLEATMEARWRKKQHQHWPSATAQHNDLKAAGVDVSHSTVCNWRAGLIPHHFTLMLIAAAGWRSIVTYVQAPAMEAGELAALEREIDERTKELTERRRELQARLAEADRLDRTRPHSPDVEPL
ncbi:hypothetical protein [Henriciella aquimarina]|uniref:hypothetical protein n=1 Tax=Henriciella aquimarina TaxID=545261 RepID=UPI00117AFA2A|nr:hypothetical protein [Henriciella aquimarina]